MAVEPHTGVFRALPDSTVLLRVNAPLPAS